MWRWHGVDSLFLTLSSSCLPPGNLVTYEPLAAEPLQMSFSEMVRPFIFVVAVVTYVRRFNVFRVRTNDLRLIVVDALS